MLRTLRMVAGAVVILTASSVLAQPPAGTDLFPLKQKSKWVYKVADKEVTVTVSGTEKFDNQDCIKLETSADGQVKASELFFVKADGVYRAKVKDDKVVPPVKILALPVKKGESWKVDSKVGNQMVKGEFKITDDKVTLKVPAGEFKDVVLVESPMFDIAGTPTVIKQWFAPGKGLIKISYTIQGQESTLELKEYVEGK